MLRTTQYRHKEAKILTEAKPRGDFTLALHINYVDFYSEIILLPLSDLNLSLLSMRILIFFSNSIVIKRLFGDIRVFLNFLTQ
jgi:hypothetical protein